MTTAAEVPVPNPRFPGVEPRHARDCPATGWNLDRCTCSPTYRGTAWSRKDGRLLKSPPFASATAAKNWAQDAKVDLRRGVRRAPAPMTVAQLAEAWLEQLEGGLVRTRSGRPYKPSTCIGYRQVIEDWIVPELGPYRLAELDHDVVQEMIERMLSGEADQQRRKKSSSTVRNAITALRAMWRHPSARRSQPGQPDGRAGPAGFGEETRPLCHTERGRDAARRAAACGSGDMGYRVVRRYFVAASSWACARATSMSRPASSESSGRTTRARRGSSRRRATPAAARSRSPDGDATG
jgi:hypothetical protein